MSQKPLYFLFLFLCFSLNTFLNAQTQNDSLAKYSYEELHQLIKKHQFDQPINSKVYATGYLKRAKLDGDKIKISRGYFYIIHYFYLEDDYKKMIEYSDSIIQICGKCEHDKYPTLGYYFKAAALQNVGKDKAALDSYLKALDLAKKNKNTRLEISLRREIVGLKSNWANNEEVLKFYLENLKFIKQQKDYKRKYKEDYLLALYNLSIEYLENKKYNESLLISNEGIKESLIYKDTINYFEFIFSSSISQYHLKNYKTSLNNLLNIPFENEYKKAISSYYIAKNYYNINQKEKAHDYFLKVDFLYIKTQDLFPELRNTYEHIVEYYKEKGDTEQQLFFLERLIKTDAKIDSVYKYVNETVNKKFDTPQAIAERARLVAALETKKNAWKYRFAAISAILLVILGILVAAFRRQKYYKRRFEKLMNTSAPLNIQKTNSEVTETGIERSRNALNVTSEKQKNQTKNIDVPKEIVDNILNQLKKFEDTKKFTKQVSITSLAKNLKTNPKYLSKVINWHYQKNFSHYISELRIEYVISRLKEDSKFRNYTIKAIAQEAGFGNTESFSKSFHKSTGIKPSYFIKELQKRLEG